MEGIEDAGCILELIVDGVLSVPGRGPAPWGDPPLEWSTMPVSSRGPRRRQSWWCHTCSSTPSTRTPAKTGKVIRCGSQTRLDMGPHGIPRSCQLSSQASDGGSFKAQLSDRPHTQTRPRGAHPLVMFQEYHRPAGAFAAYPASLKPPEPRRDPGPGRVDHLHHHAPVALSNSAHNQGTPPAGCTTQHQAPEYLGCEPRSSDGSPPNRQADHTDQATWSSSR